MNIFSPVDRFLNPITMYRLVTYGLSLLALLSLIFSLFGIIHYDFSSLLLSLVFLISICYITNYFCAKIFKAPINFESQFITALILFFVMSPVRSIYDIKIILLAGFLAMISKYIIAYRAKHIFNPVAISMVIIGFLGSGNVIWWIGSKTLFPVVLVISLLIVRKIRKFPMFLSFISASLILMTLSQYLRGFGDISSLLSQNIFSWPTIFFAGIMLTEPLTTPPTKKTENNLWIYCRNII